MVDPVCLSSIHYETDYYIGGRFLWQKIPLGKMEIVMAHNPNMVIEQLEQPMRLLRPRNIRSHDNDDVMF